MTEADILDRAADLIEPPGAWTRKELARDARGRAVDVNAPTAVSWCCSGAVAYQCGGFGNARAMRAIDALERLTGHRLSRWNDAPQRTQAKVVAALRKAAQTLRDQAGEK